jgi:chromosome segregation ATPase
MNESLKLLSQALPQLAVIAAICAWIGWTLRGKSNKPAEATAKAQPTKEKGLDRAKNLESALEKAKAAQKSIKAELEQLQAQSVSKSDLESATAELDTLRQSIAADAKRSAALEADLKKAQDTIRNLNARANEANKSEKDRNFALENELSKTRQELAILQERPDDSATLLAEIERLRESVAVSTRFAGEVRKREAAANEALEKAQAQIAAISDPSRPAPAPSKKVGPVAESSRIAAAKAEVLRLLEQNKIQAEIPETAIAEPDTVVADTDAVIADTEVVIANTEVAIADTDAVIANTEVVVAETEVVVANTEAVVANTDAVVANTDAVVADTEVVVADTDAPIADTEVVVADADAVVAETEAPIADTEAPIEAAAAEEIKPAIA